MISLREFDLAVNLLAQLWPDGNASDHVASNVLEAALNSKSEQTQIAVSSVLLQNASHIDQPGFHLWPIPNQGWRTDLAENCRLGLILAAAEWLKSIVKKGERGLSDVSTVLYQALEDSDPTIVDISVQCLKAVGETLTAEDCLYSPGSINLTFKQITERLAQHNDAPLTSYGEKYYNEIKSLYELIPDRTGQDITN